MAEEGNMTPEEMIALSAVLNVLVVGAQHDLRQLGHMQTDPRQSPTYAALIKELVRRGRLPSDDSFAPSSSTEEQLQREGIGAGMKPLSFGG